MRIRIRVLHLAVAIGAVFLFATTAQAKTVSYPPHGKAAAMADVPDSWKVTPAKDEADWTDMASPGGTILQMRTMESDKETMKAAADETADYIEKTYSDVALKGEPCSINGMNCSAAYGTGKEKDGTPVNIAAFVFALKDGHIGELWYVAPTADKEGVSEATKVLGSYRSP